MPVCPELVREHIPKTKDVGHFLSVTGTVIRTSLVKVLEYERDYMCNKCKHVFVVQADFEQYYTFCRPSSCPSLESCDSSKFTCLSDMSSSPARCRDYQEIKIQEQVNNRTRWKKKTHTNLEVLFCTRAKWLGLENTEWKQITLCLHLVEDQSQSCQTCIRIYVLETMK